MSWLQTRQPAPFLNEETQRYCHLGGKLENPAAHIDFWKSWWTSHQSELK
jgi:hypothetical protein